MYRLGLAQGLDVVARTPNMQDTNVHVTEAGKGDRELRLTTRYTDPPAKVV